jgi:RNA polymerase sigma-B factor
VIDSAGRAAARAAARHETGDERKARAAAKREQAMDLFARLNEAPEGSSKRQRLRDELVELHLPLVEYLARRFTGRNEPLGDLVQVGVIGLIKSIDRFDTERGLEFSTYATPTILGEIKRHFRDAGWLVRVPRRLQELQTAMSTTRSELSHELGRAPSAPELAKRLDISEDEVVDVLESARAYAGVPLDSMTVGRSGQPVHETLGDVDARLDHVESREALRPMIESLPERERQILVLRFFASKTQAEIAGIVGLSQMQVSRLVARSLAKLRDQLVED